MSKTNRILCIVLTLILTVTLLTIPAFGVTGDSGEANDVNVSTQDTVSGASLDEEQSEITETEPSTEVQNPPPGDVEGLKAEPFYLSAKISWKAVEGADGYVISTSADPENADNDIISDSAKVEQKYKDLEGDKLIKYSVWAYKEYDNDGTTEVVYSENPATVNVTPYGKSINGLLVEPAGKHSIFVDWDAIPGVEYKIFRYTKAAGSSGGSWSAAKEITPELKAVDTNRIGFIDSGLTDFNRSQIFSYKYTVQVSGVTDVDGNPAIIPATEENPEESVILSATKEGQTVRPLYAFFKMKKNKPYYNTYKLKDKKKRGRLGKNAAVLGMSRLDGRWQFDLTGKENYKWMAEKNMKRLGYYYTQKSYSKRTAESFVNNYSSKTKYLIWLNKYTQHVYIFEGSKGNWKQRDQYGSNLCATGRIKNNTIQGTFKVYKRYRTQERKKYHFFYSTRWSSIATFHTRLYKKKSTTKFYDSTIGKPKSLGCVRLYTDAAMWIYKNVPNGTTVISY